MRGGDHDAAGSAQPAHAKRERRRGRDLLRQLDWDASGCNHLGTGTGEGFRKKTRIVADAQSLCRSLRWIFAGVKIGGDRGCGGAHIFKGEIAGDDSPPAVGSKLDHRMRHACRRSSIPISVPCAKPVLLIEMKLAPSAATG